MNNTLTDVNGILVGHAQDDEALTGCTVILIPKGAVGGVEQRGGSPGTRETDLLRPMHLVQKVHAIVLAGGSAFGLDAASGVMRWLEEKNIGFSTGFAKVPIVPSAILFDLGIGKANKRPDAEMGYLAAQNATEKPVVRGNVGAGTGATVGKLFGMGQAMKSGIGCASIDAGNGIIVSALIAVNAFGDIIDPKNRQIIAGTRSMKKGGITIGENPIFADTNQSLRTFAGKTILSIASRSNTVIGVVATNAKLDKDEINKVAQMAMNGLALAVQPACTMFDGDTLFSVATCEKNADVNVVGSCAVEAVAKAIIDAALSAEPSGGLPSAMSLNNL